MSILSKETEMELANDVLNVIKEAMSERENDIDMISRQDLCKKLGVSVNTIKEWELHGLRRSEIPFSRLIFYRKSEVYRFSGLG